MLRFYILNSMLNYMEKYGLTKEQLQVYIDENLVSEINKDNNTNFTLDEFNKEVDICIANELLERTNFGGNYTQVRITQKGKGFAVSKKKSNEIEKSRSLLKKVSDGLLEYKGILSLIGVFIALVGLIISF